MLGLIIFLVCWTSLLTWSGGMVAYMTDAVLANITKQKVLIDQIIYFVPNWQITNN